MSLLHTLLHNWVFWALFAFEGTAYFLRPEWVAAFAPFRLRARRPVRIPGGAASLTAQGGSELGGYRKEPRWQLDWRKLSGPREFGGDDWVAHFFPEQRRVVVRLRMRYFFINSGLAVARVDLVEADGEIRMRCAFAPAPFWAFVLLGVGVGPMALRLASPVLGVLAVMGLAALIVVVPVVATRARLVRALSEVAGELELRVRELAGVGETFDSDRPGK